MSRKLKAAIKAKEKELAKVLGAKLLRVELNAWDDGPTVGIVFEPLFVFDNGEKMRFKVLETEEGASYGVEPYVQK